MAVDQCIQVCPGRSFASWRQIRHPCRLTFAPKRKSIVIFGGFPATHEYENEKLAEWCAGAIARGDFASFKELLGPFAVIADEPARRRMTFVSDVLGIRPLFLGTPGGRVVFGTDVWSMYKAGWSSGTINYDAVASWVTYTFNATSTSLFGDLDRLPAGSAVTFQDGKRSDFRYAEFGPLEQRLTPEELPEAIHEIVSSAVKTLLTENSKVCVPLSGGYDSRYLLALALQILPSPSLRCVNVPLTPNEGLVAQRVAQTLGLSLDSISARDSEWDLFDEVYHFTPDGFPISKNLSHPIAERYAGIPFLNGFLGGPLVRGVNDQFLGKWEPDWKDPVATLQEKLRTMGFDIFRKDVASAILKRSLVPMQEAVKATAKLGKASDWVDFYYNQRLRMSNNFLQHLNLSEALLPFYDWRLLSLKIGHDYSCFDRRNYQRIFQRYFPSLAVIPHADDLPLPKPPKVAGCVKRWARSLLPKLVAKDHLSGLLKKRSCLLAVAAMAGDRRAESSILAMKASQDLRAAPERIWLGLLTVACNRDWYRTEWR